MKPDNNGTYAENLTAQRLAAEIERRRVQVLNLRVRVDNNKEELKEVKRLLKISKEKFRTEQAVLDALLKVQA